MISVSNVELVKPPITEIPIKLNPINGVSAKLPASRVIDITDVMILWFSVQRRIPLHHSDNLPVSLWNDLVYCIKGFMRMYSELFLFFNVPFDLNVLSKSLVEKTKTLATYTTVPFISEELIQMISQPANEEVTKEQLQESLTQIMEEMEESIEKESLILLKQHLIQPTLNRAIVKGLLENIQNHSHCKWIFHLLRRYFQF
jgi:hypothetical protein